MVLESARRRLADLAPLAEHLNRSTDEFTEQISVMQAQLIELSPGIEVTLEDPLGEDSLQHSRLSFRRVGSSWGFFIIGRDYSHELDAYVEEEIPLLSASRDARIAAAAQIDEVIQRISDSVMKKVGILNKVIAESPMPTEWSNFQMGTDEADLVHLLDDITDAAPGAEALCGAHIVALFRADRGRPCPRCLRLEEEGRDDIKF